MRYEAPLLPWIVTVMAAFVGTVLLVLLVPPAHSQQQLPIQSPAAQSRYATAPEQPQTGLTPAQSVASITSPQTGASLQTQSAESTPAQKAPDPIEAAMAALPASLSTSARHEFETAFTKLPSFCHDWEGKLHERQINNLAHLVWQEKNGYETATYVGYGKVDGCQCKESVEGVPIGKITYDEYEYYLVGKTLKEAGDSKPKVIGTTHTLEIFSWDKEQWFY